MIIASQRPSLARTVSFRIAAVACVTLLVQMVVVVIMNYFDYDSLYLDHITYEARSLLNGVKVDPDGIAFSLPHGLTRYRNAYGTAYAFRVIDASGRVVAANQPELIEAISPWTAHSAAPPNYWFRRLDQGGRFYFAGGRSFRLNNTDVLVEMATLGDPANVHWWVVARETFEDAWLPILPFALLIPLVTLVSVRRALSPLVRAAQQAEAINPGDVRHRFDLARLPPEAAAFASAIDRLMQRVAALVTSQKVFIASAAHELRTPLAVMLLELERIDHPRARRLEDDVAGMSDSVDRLMLLAQFDTVNPPHHIDVDLTRLVADTTDRLNALAMKRGHKLEIRHQEPSRFLRADPVAIREAVRNLVENAIRHTPAGSSIRVTIGPGPTVAVEDNGPGLPAEFSDQLFEPFQKGSSSTEGAGLGLAIVRRAVERHGGAVETRRSQLGGAMFLLRFPSNPEQAVADLGRPVCPDKFARPIPSLPG